MADQDDRTEVREHLREIRRALGGIGQDVKVDLEDAPHNVKEGTRNTLARAAGIKRTPMREWSPPATQALDGSSGSR
jgi:hypothetical protein